ncbi:hypothetical protein ONS96_006748 [Cadophora gregata f. sp. sojae]|nr:hypothetical protein ONS96_006748 [Cadophora gregata f. sp. sojae]
MQNLGPQSVIVALLSSILLSVPHIHAQDIKGLPTCANECALNFMANSNCPLTNQTCICNYLSFYDECVDKECNTTEFALAYEPPVPYYIPEATISISKTPLCSLSTPNFPRPSATAVVASTSERESTSSTTTAPKTTDSATSSATTSFAQAGSATATTSQTSAAEPTISTSTLSEAGGQTNNNNPLSQTRTTKNGSTRTSGVVQVTSTGGALVVKVVDLRIVAAGLMGFVMAVV